VSTEIRAAVLASTGRPLQIEALALDPPQVGEVEVKMVAAGVCHSDVPAIDGDWERPTNVIFGHEGAGVITAIGPGVQTRQGGEAGLAEGLAVGDLVILSAIVPCRRCARCVHGEPWLCRQSSSLSHRLGPSEVRVRRPDGSPVGVYTGIGTYSERQVIDARAAMPVDPKLPHTIAGLLGCAIATGWGAVVNTAQVRAGESVAVVGVGGVGLTAVMASVLVGANRVVAIDMRADKLERARRAGASDALLLEGASQATAVDGVLALTDGGADHVIEAAGTVSAAELAVSLTRRGGITTLAGMPGSGDRIMLDGYSFVDDGKQLRGSNMGATVPAVDYPRIAALYLRGRIPLDLLLEESIALTDLEVAHQQLRSASGLRRVVRFEDGDTSRSFDGQR
jgi:S-(hydroxymethyl)glutathione dehydrogenase / alcohol dehydrogenase